MNLNNITENPFFPHMFPVLEAAKLVCYPYVADARKEEVVRGRSGSQEHQRLALRAVAFPFFS